MTIEQRPATAADLASLAVETMWEAILELPDTESLADSVYVFFDVSQPPGREFAASALAHDQEIDRERALAVVEASAAAATERGDAVGVGAFFGIDDLVSVLERYVIDEPSRSELQRLEDWLERSVPDGYCRLVIVAGVELRASITRVAFWRDEHASLN